MNYQWVFALRFHSYRKLSLITLRDFVSTQMSQFHRAFVTSHSQSVFRRSGVCAYMRMCVCLPNCFNLKTTEIEAAGPGEHDL